MNREDLTLTGQDAEFERRAQALLRESAEALDGRVRSRLTQARFAALGALEAREGAPRFRVPGRWLPAGALAAAAVLAFAVWLAQPAGTPNAVLAEASPVEDAELLASNDGIDLYTDDADFYEWAGSVETGDAG